MSRRVLHVVAAVIERDGQILVSLRRPKGARPSQWEFPGGKLEPGETDSQALVRELREELGVECAAGRLIRRIKHEYADVDVEIGFYEASIVQGTPQPLEMTEIRWVPRAELEKLDFLAADRPFVADLVRGVV